MKFGLLFVFRRFSSGDEGRRKKPALRGMKVGHAQDLLLQ